MNAEMAVLAGLESGLMEKGDKMLYVLHYGRVVEPSESSLSKSFAFAQFDHPFSQYARCTCVYYFSASESRQAKAFVAFMRNLSEVYFDFAVFDSEGEWVEL